MLVSYYQRHVRIGEALSMATRLTAAHHKRWSTAKCFSLKKRHVTLCDWRHVLTVHNLRQRSNVGDGTVIDFSSVRTSLTTFERQVHLRLHSSAPSQRICGRRSGTACIWVWLHTGWTTTLVPTTNAWQSRLMPGSYTADFISRNSATVIWKRFRPKVALSCSCPRP